LATEIGKRYTCDSCGAQVLAIKAGTGELECCSTPMALMDPKPIPSGD
jgi:desulfoferrodoxin-like iron-binding protein